MSVLRCAIKATKYDTKTPDLADVSSCLPWVITLSNPDEKPARATIGYNVITCSQYWTTYVAICDYHEEKKKKKQIRPNF